MLSPALVAATPASGGGPYHASAVVFVGAGGQGAELDTASLTSNSMITVAVWVKFTTDGLNVFQVVSNFGGQLTPGNNFTTDIGGSLQGATGQFFSFGSMDGLLSADEWFHIFISADMGHPDGEKSINLRLNGVDVLDPANTTDGNSAFQIYFPLGVAQIPDTGGEPFNQSYADFQCWIGQMISPTAGNMSKFISGAKPVDPALAAAAFGQQSVLYSGNKDTFPVNQGSLGVPSLTGALENDPSGPSA